jgi:hypothetical protein
VIDALSRTREILDDAPLARYQVQRGYAAGRCDTLPEGRDREMYRRPMGCK